MAGGINLQCRASAQRTGGCTHHRSHRLQVVPPTARARPVGGFPSPRARHRVRPENPLGLLPAGPIRVLRDAACGCGIAAVPDVEAASHDPSHLSRANGAGGCDASRAYPTDVCNESRDRPSWRNIPVSVDRFWWRIGWERDARPTGDCLAGICPRLSRQPPDPASNAAWVAASSIAVLRTPVGCRIAVPGGARQEIRAKPRGPTAKRIVVLSPLVRFDGAAPGAPKPFGTTMAHKAGMGAYGDQTRSTIFPGLFPSRPRPSLGEQIRRRQELASSPPLGRSRTSAGGWHSHHCVTHPCGPGEIARPRWSPTGRGPLPVEPGDLARIGPAVLSRRSATLDTPRRGQARDEHRVSCRL